MCSQSSVGFQPTKKRKRKRQITILLIIVILVTNAAMSCESTKPKPIINDPIIFNVESAEQWFESVEKIKENGEDHEYIINILDDFQLPHSTENTFGNTRNISVLIKGKHTISLGKYGTLFTIGYSQNLTIEDVILQGVDEQDDPGPASPFLSLLIVKSGILTLQGETVVRNNIGGINNEGGTFNLTDNATIKNHSHTGVITAKVFNMSGNAAITDNHTAVLVNGGEFNLYDGTISDNNHISIYQYDYETSGVLMGGGTFVMHGGSITRNMYNNGTHITASAVFMMGGRFIMKGGSISNNSLRAVYVNGVFLMEGGIIASNEGDAAVFMLNSPQKYFIMSGGVIYGNNYYGEPDSLANSGKTLQKGMGYNTIALYGDLVSILPFGSEENEFYTYSTIIGIPSRIPIFPTVENITIDRIKYLIENHKIRSEQ